MALDRIKIINICDKIILFSLYIIAFFFPISKAIIEIFSTLAIVCYIVKKAVQRENLPKMHINLAILAYLFICFFSIFVSSNSQISARVFWGKTIQDILFFFVIVDTLNSERRIKNFIYILFASSLLLGIDGIYQHFTHKEFIRNRPYYGLPRIHATFPTPNDFGCYLITIIPFILACFFVNFRFKLTRFLFASLLILLFTCLMLTVSRGAWSGFLVSLLFMTIWISPLGIFLLILGIFIIVIQQFPGSFMQERLRNFFIFLDHSGIDRKTIWQAGWKMFISRPWLGVGIGTFMFNFMRFAENGYPYGVPYAHNCYLQMLSETGVIGLISFLSILILFFYSGIEIIRKREKTFSWYISLASLAAVLGYSVQMAVDTIFYSLDLGMLFWILLGLGIAAMNNIRLETVTPIGTNGHELHTNLHE